MDLADRIFLCTESFPQQEMHGMVSQMRDASVSIPSNIAEGSPRTTNKDFANFILIAKGSLAELETQIMLAARRKYLTPAQEKDLLEKTGERSKMIFSFYGTLKSQDS